MVKNGSSGSLGKVALVIVLAIVASGIGTWAWIKSGTDSNGNGVSDLREILSGKDPLGGGPAATKAPATTTAPRTTPVPTSTGGTPPPSTTQAPTYTKPPVYTTPPPYVYTPPPAFTYTPEPTTSAPTATAPPATPPPQGYITIADTRMNTLYAIDNPPYQVTLYEKIFLLRPGDAIHEKVAFNVEGAPVEGVSIEFSLLQGGLNAGILRHEVDGYAIPQQTLNLGHLEKGQYNKELIGTVPAYNPGRDWYEGLIVIKGNGKEQARMVNTRDDDPTKPKWLTLAYDNVWSMTPQPAYVSSVSSAKREGAGVILYFNTNTIGSGLSSVDVYQLSYPGKWRQVYGGSAQPCASQSTFLGVTIPCWVDSSQSSIFIPFANFAPAKAYESYLKVNAFDSSGNQLDLNAAGNDIAARINIPYDVEGGSAWSGTQEYFSVFGVNRFLPFSVFGNNGHPERQYFG